MTDTVAWELAQRKVAHFERSLELLATQIDGLTTRIRDEERQLQAWKLILAAEQPESDNAADAVITHAGNPTAVVQAKTFSDARPYGEKTALLRRFLEEAGNTGTTPGGLQARLEQSPVEVSANFAYNTLFKMKQRGEVAERNGRYVLVSNLEDQQQTPP